MGSALIVLLLVLTGIVVSWYGGGDSNYAGKSVDEHCPETTAKPLCVFGIHTLAVTSKISQKMYRSFGLEDKDLMGGEESGICYDTAGEFAVMRSPRAISVEQAPADSRQIALDIMFLTGFVLAVMWLFVVFELEYADFDDLTIGSGKFSSDGTAKMGWEWSKNVAEMIGWPVHKLPAVNIASAIKVLAKEKSSASKHITATKKAKKQIKGGNFFGVAASALKGSLNKQQAKEEFNRDFAAANIENLKRDLRSQLGLLNAADLKDTAMAKFDKTPSILALAHQAIYNARMIPKFIDHAVWIAGIVGLILWIAVWVTGGFVSDMWNPIELNPCFSTLYLSPFFIVATGYWVYLMLRNLVGTGALMLTELLPGWIVGLIMFMFYPGGENKGRDAVSRAIGDLVKLGLIMFVVTSRNDLIRMSPIWLFALQAGVAGIAALQLAISVYLSVWTINGVGIILEGGENVSHVIEIFLKVKEIVSRTISGIGSAIMSFYEGFVVMLTSGSISGFADLKDKIVGGYDKIANSRRQKAQAKQNAILQKQQAAAAKQAASQKTKNNLLKQGVAATVVNQAEKISGGLEALGAWLSGSKPQTLHKVLGVEQVSPDEIKINHSVKSPMDINPVNTSDKLKKIGGIWKKI